MKIGYCQMTYKGDLEKTIENVVKIKPYVDECIVVYDDSLSLEDINKLSDAGALGKYHEYHDNFPEQRNNYLKEARLLGMDWVLVSDPDEHHDEIFLKSLKPLVDYLDPIGVSMCLIWAHDIFTDDDYGVTYETITELTPDYKKNLLFKLMPEVHYKGIGITQNYHEDLVGNFRTVIAPKEFFYRHIKSHREIWEHSARSIWICGGGMNMGNLIPIYPEFTRIVKERLKLDTWYKFRDYLKTGNIDQELKDFIIKNRNQTGADWTSEYRELFKYYFYLLHPEENVDHLKNDIDRS